MKCHLNFFAVGRIKDLPWTVRSSFTQRAPEVGAADNTQAAARFVGGKGRLLCLCNLVLAGCLSTWSDRRIKLNSAPKRMHILCALGISRCKQLLEPLATVGLRPNILNRIYVLRGKPLLLLGFVGLYFS